MNLVDARKNLAQSHQRITHLINTHTNEELFTRSYYKWTKTTTLGAYFVSATASHYDWAVKKIKKYKKSI